MNHKLCLLLVVFVGLMGSGCATDRCRCAGEANPAPLVLMTDFSLKDGAVSAMKGVATQVDPRLKVSDLTHEIPPYNIWEGAYRLSQTYKFWPKGTVFVTVVDPGVGSERHSLIARSKSGHIFVGPDNGLYTLIDDENGFESVHVINENLQRRKGSEDSYTFHGRDLYVYVGARVAAGQLSLDQAGPVNQQPLVKIAYQKATADNGVIRGLIPILDTNYGNVWTNIPKALVGQQFPELKKLQIKIFKGGKRIYAERVPLVDTFAGVPSGRPLLYFNSLLNLAIALNMADFAKKYNIGSGPKWTIEVSR